jgi:hypothetical protein
VANDKKNPQQGVVTTEAANLIHNRRVLTLFVFVCNSFEFMIAQLIASSITAGQFLISQTHV